MNKPLKYIKDGNKYIEVMTTKTCPICYTLNNSKNLMCSNCGFILGDDNDARC